MKYLLIILLTVNLNATAQITVKVAGNHEIEVPDELSEKVVKRYEHYMETNPINYEKSIRKTKAIVMVDRNRYYVSDFKNGILYLNSRLNDKPSSKELAIIQHFSIQNGMPVTRKKMSHVSSVSFDITDKNEERFRRQLKRHNPYKYIVEQLEQVNPLKSKR